MTTALAILASGTGTNARALLGAADQGALGDAAIVVVASDRRECGALEAAAAHGVPGVFVDPVAAPGREAYSAALRAELQERRVDLVCLAGFMRILSADFIAAYPGRVLNIHPALLPSFPGAHAVADALAWGVKVTGTTVHFADEAVDHGPILAQEAVAVREGDDVDSLHQRIKAVEHRLYPAAARLVVEGRTRIVGRRVLIDGAPARVAAELAERQTAEPRAQRQVNKTWGAA